MDGDRATTNNLEAGHKVPSKSMEIENVPVDADPEEQVTFSDIFPESVLQFLFVDEVAECSRGVCWVDIALAMVTYCTQCALYIYLTAKAYEKWDQDMVNITMNWYDCARLPENEGQRLVPAGWYVAADSLMCDMGEEPNTWGLTIPALIMFTWFIASDIVGSITLFARGGLTIPRKCRINHVRARFTAVLVLVEALLAFCCCSWMAAAALISGGVHDAVLAAVGVTFIHDLDEKVRSIYPYMFNPKPMYLLFTSILLFVAPIVFNGGVRGGYHIAGSTLLDALTTSTTTEAPSTM